jgi:hypothetical protein
VSPDHSRASPDAGHARSIAASARLASMLVAHCDALRDRVEVTVLSNRRGPPAVVGRPGPVESTSKWRDRATVLVEDMWCAKIRGCSYRRRDAPHSMSAMFR